MPTTFPPGTLSGSGVGTTPDPSPIPSGRLHFYVNTTPFTLDHPAPELTVLQFLRQEGFTGTKLGCAEGGCGACTVVVAAWHATAGKVTHHSANGCLLPLCTLDGKQVITVEGIGTAKAPHPVQERLALMHGSQCGFCTPGIAMSLYSLLRNNPTPTVHDVEGTFDGNLCRCTGYRPILDAAKTFVVPQVTPDLGEAAGHACPGAHGCGRTSCSADERSACAAGDQAKLADIEDLHPIDTTAGLKFRPYDPSQDLAFPTALVDYVRSGGSATGNEGDSVAQGGRPPHVFRGEVCEAFHRPVTLTHLLQLKRDHPDCKLLAGNTEVGIETKFKSQPYPIRVYVGDIPELQTVKILEDGVAFGASITLTHFRNELQDLMASQSTERTEGFKALLTSLRWLAGNQIRNVATLAGNVVSAAPTSDLNPVLLACGAILTLQAHGSMLRQVPITEFLTRNGPPALGRHEVVTTIHIPFSRPGQYIRSYKQSKRKTDGKAIVNAGLLLDLESHEAATAQESGSDWVIRRCQLAFGGVGSTTVQAIATASTMVGRTMHDPTTFQDLLAAAKGELQLDIDCPGGMAEYRLSLVTGFLFKFWHEVCCALGIAGLTVDQATLTQEIPREPSSGLQFYAAVQDTSEVSQPRPHLSGLTHTTGETHYTDDIPPVTRELYGAPVLAGPARAKILRIDPAPALALPGVIRFFGHGDVPGTNLLGPIAQDECLFAENEVNFSGQILGLIVAKDRGTAQRAAKLVRVEYEYLTPILTIDEAIAQKSFYGGDRVVESGDVESGFTEADHIFEGEYRVGGQEHFYLETQAGRVVPLGEGDEVEVFASTQNPSFVQRGVASVLGIPRNRVTCRVKRLGGGFGGKEMRPTFLAGALAVAAYHLNRPVRCMMERDEDMITSGQRHPFLGRWKAGFTVDGKFTTLALELYSNAGHSLDTSLMVVENAMLHADNVYHIPHMRVRGHACRTNVHSNTSMRGFGTPQCIFIIESLLDECADRLGLPAHVVRERNFKVEGQTAYFGSALHDWHLKKTWDAALRTSDFTTRRREIDQFNQTSHWKKRGLAVMASRNTVGYPDKFLNQAGALVQIYTDGTVLVSHGGTEMGQGLHTKMAQICAEELDIPLSTIYISETSTDKVPNTTSTSASSGSELNGMAVLDACRQLSARLQPFRERMPEATFKDLIMAAYYDRVSLSASGFHKVPNVSYDFATQKGIPAFYFTTGTAVCEVELDVLTGDHVVRRTDIVMEIARSLNPAIDIGQIEGGFVQGMGWCTTEETLFNPDGALLTRGPNTYNIPTARDVPRDFRVHILPNLSYQKLQAVHGSKAVGEHPVSLANSVPLALRDAVKAARADPHLRMAPGMLSENTHEADPPASTLGDSVILHAPATAEQLRMLCQDTIARTCTIPQELKEDRIPAVVRISGQSCSAA